MGLDSVELLVSFENYFGISIPDAEAEKIGTVQELCDSVCRHLSITASGEELRDSLFLRLRQALRDSSLIRMDVDPDDPLHLFLKNDPGVWQHLSRSMGLSVPDFPRKTEKTWIGRLLPSWESIADFEHFSFAELCDVIGAANYERLIAAGKCSTRYEVYICVMAITSDKTGVDLYEISPEKSFTTDFGID